MEVKLEIRNSNVYSDWPDTVCLYPLNFPSINGKKFVPLKSSVKANAQKSYRVKIKAP